MGQPVSEADGIVEVVRKLLAVTAENTSSITWSDILGDY